VARALLGIEPGAGTADRPRRCGLPAAAELGHAIAGWPVVERGEAAGRRHAGVLGEAVALAVAAAPVGLRDVGRDLGAVAARIIATAAAEALAAAGAGIAELGGRDLDPVDRNALAVVVGEVQVTSGGEDGKGDDEAVHAVRSSKRCATTERVQRRAVIVGAFSFSRASGWRSGGFPH
jgi:hypothetical protein